MIFEFLGLEASAALMLLLAEKSGVKVPDQMASLLVGEGTPSVARRGSAPDISVSPSADLVLSVGETPPKRSPDAEASTSVLQPMTAIELASRVSVAASAVLLAISIPNFGFVVGLLGAFSSMLISFILPAAFYLHVHWSSLGAGSTMLCISIAIVGFVGSTSTNGSNPRLADWRLTCYSVFRPAPMAGQCSLACATRWPTVLEYVFTS